MIRKIQRFTVCAIIMMVLLISGGCNRNDTTCKITQLTVNYETNPIGIEQAPMFGWRMESDEAGQAQTAYRIVIAASNEELENDHFIWDSGKVESDLSVAIPYAGGALDAGARYVWKVFVWTKDGAVVESSEEAAFEMGLTDHDWSGASWIGIRTPENRSSNAGANYTIEYDVKLGKTYSGFVWGMDTDRYGSYFRCDFNTLKEQIAFSITKVSDSEESSDTVVLNEVFPDRFGSVEEFCDRAHHVALEVKEKTVNVVVDNIQIGTFSLSGDKALGGIGFWTARGIYYAYYDNLVVQDSDCETIIKENFDNRDNTIFLPYYIKISDGWCEASSGFILANESMYPAPMLRRCLVKDSDSAVSSARLYATALGDYRLYINGEDICGEYLTPGRSRYSEETYYRTYDVTDFLANDREVDIIGAVLGHGRYDKSNANWGAHIAFQAKLVITYEDGSTQTIVTDDAWQAYADGPIRNDDMYLGEYYDATKEQNGWCINADAVSGWRNADLFPEYDGLIKRAAESAAVKCVATIMPISVSEPIKGEYVYDFGQNFNGNCSITFKDTKNKQGKTVTIRYAEALNAENMSCRDDEVGTIWTQNLYMADNTDYYTIGGFGEETYTPRLVCRGFRYVQISGLDEPLPIADVNGLVLSTDNQRTGYFACSDENVNRLYDSIYWTQLSNYLDVPTDCPQRDERFGWAGDAQVFANTAAYNADVCNYLGKYTEMLIRCQSENGAFAEIAPSKDTGIGANGWSDAGIILVWELYQQYGNDALIRNNLDAMCRYVDYLVDTSEDYVRSMHHYSDHNAVSVLEDDIADTAQCAYAAKLLSKMCLAVGEQEAAMRYDTVYNQYKKAWQQHYVNADGSIDCWLQSAYTLGLAYELYPEELAAKGAECLNNAVIANDYHLNTGYIATQFLLPVLCQYGYVDTAYRVLQQDTYPSWNNMLSRNQTTLTEAWYTYYQTGEGTYAINGSLNHAALGSVGQWLYSDLLGIRRDENNPGYKHFYIEPQVGGGLLYASGSYECVYGTIESSWSVEENELVFRFLIPPNTTATISLPDKQYQNMELVSGKYEYRIALNKE